MGKRKGEILSLTALLFVFMLTTLFFYMVYNMHYDSASDDFTGFTVFDYQSEPGMPTSSSLGSLPEEVEESAKVDGATEWQLFCRIVLPLVAPGIAAVAMLSFMYAWNEYTYTVIFTRTAVNNTVPLALALLNTEDNLTNFGLVAAGGVVSVIPITLFVIFAQNYLISGLSSGAVKE